MLAGFLVGCFTGCLLGVLFASLLTAGKWNSTYLVCLEKSEMEKKEIAEVVDGVPLYLDATLPHGGIRV